MKVIASIAEKGGVGKTTMACVLAAGMRVRGHRVLLISLDLQGSSSGVFLERIPAESGTAQLLLKRGFAPLSGHLGVDVLSGGMAMDGGDIRSLAHDELRFALQPLAAQYDIAVIDAPPILQHLHRLTIDAADVALVITDATSLESVAGLAKVISEIETARARGRHAPHSIVPVINCLNRRTTLEAQIADGLIARYPGLQVLEIPRTTVVASAIASRRPEMALQSDSPAQPALQVLIEIGERLIGKVVGGHAHG